MSQFLRCLFFSALLILPRIGVAQMLPAPISDGELTPFRSSLTGLYGYLDKNGAEIIPAQFEYAETFSDGLARIHVGDKLRYIDSTGSFAIPLSFEKAEYFHDGLALAWTNSQRKYGYIDKTGKFAIQPKFDDGDANYGNDTRYFSEGLAPFASKGKFGFIDSSGSVVISPQFWSVSAFSMGIASVVLSGQKPSDDNLYALIDKKGQYIIPPRVGYLGQPSEGLVVFDKKTLHGDRSGYLSLTGHVSIPASFVEASDFHEGLAKVCTSKCEKYGFIDRDGKLVIPEIFVSAENFSDGLALVKQEDKGLYGFIDHTGKFVIPPRYASAGSFKSGLAGAIIQGMTSEGFTTKSPVLSGLIRLDGTNAYVWTIPTVSAVTGCAPYCHGSSFMTADAPLLDLTLSSVPTGADIFAVPYSVYDFDKSIVDSDARLAPFAITMGRTDVKTKLFSQKYHLLFRRQNKRAEVDFDLFKSGPDKCVVNFQ